MRTITTVTAKIAEWASALLLAAAGVVVVIDVLNRNITGFPLPWGGELAGYIMVWFTFIGSAAVSGRRDHIKIEYLQAVVSPKRAAVLKLIEHSVAIIFCLLLMRYGLQFALVQQGRAAVTLHFSMLVPTISLALGGLLMLILEIGNALTALGDLRACESGDSRSAGGPPDGSEDGVAV